MNEDHKRESAPVVQESNIRGEKIIFDMEIKQKLAHVIVVKDGKHYHINLDGEDLGSFTKENDSKVYRYGQPRGAADDFEELAFEDVAVSPESPGLHPARIIHPAILTS